MDNHSVTTPNQKPTQLDTFRVELMSDKGDYYKKIVNYFDGDKDRANKFMSAVVYSVQKNPKLLEADKGSLFNAAMACAEFKLYPSNVAGEAFIIPYKGKAQFQLGYQGLVTLLYRAGITIQSEIVRKNDVFNYEAGLEPKLEHRPKAFATAEERGDPVGAFAVATLKDGRTYHKVMSAAEILGFKEFSQAKDSEYSPWKSKNDPELWMWKKTVIKQLAKTIPKTEEIAKAIGEDNEESTVAERNNALDAAGPAVGAPSHKPEPAPAAASKPAPQGKLCPAGKHPADKMATGECEYCTAEEFDQRPAEEK
jgi:recombination protein RecT